MVVQDHNMIGEKKLLPKKPLGKEFVTNFDYDEDMLDISFDEDFWMSGEPEQEGEPPVTSGEENCFQHIWDINVMVNQDSAPPSEAQIIAESPDCTFVFSKDASEEFDDNWGQGSYHAPAALVEGRQDALELEERVSSPDIVKYALGQCDIAGFDQMEDDIITLEVDTDTAASIFDQVPEPTTQTFIHQPPQTTPAPTYNLLQPLSPVDSQIFSTSTPPPSQENPITQSSSLVYGQYPGSPTQITPTISTPIGRKSLPVTRKRVGRPERKTPRTITEVPMKSSALLSQSELRNLKYRRMRDLNNEASKKCRQKRKEKLSVMEEVCKEEEKKNKMLIQKLKEMESEFADWKLKCKSQGILCGNL